MHPRVRIIAVFLVALALLAACSGNKVVGKYISDDNPDRYRQLNADRTFYSKEGNIGFAGTYRVEGDEITYSLGFGIAMKGQIKGNIIIDEDGERWVKEGSINPTKPTMAIDPGTSSVASGKSIELTAILRAGQDPLQGKEISWTASLGKCSPTSGKTDSFGKAVTTCYAPSERPEKLPLSITVNASFSGSVLYTKALAIADISVKRGTYVEGSIAPPTITSGGSVRVTGTLRDEQGNPLPGKEVVPRDIRRDERSQAPTGGYFDPSSGVTDANGQFAFTYTAPAITGMIVMDPFFPGDDTYLESREARPPRERAFAWLEVRLSPAGQAVAVPAVIKVKRMQSGNGCSATDPGPVQSLDLEKEYLPIVVASENGTAGVPLEALKAQAVASRTFAIYKMQYEPRSSSFHVCDTQADQVYNPSVAVSPQVRKAVEETRGIVGKWSGEVIAAFFVKGDTASGTAQFATVNEGKKGKEVQPTTLGSSANTHNRGAMSQDKANELAAQGWDYQRILRYFYGADVDLSREAR